GEFPACYYGGVAFILPILKKLSINGQKITFYVSGKTQFSTLRDSQGWDSAPNNVEDDTGTLTLKSLRQLLESSQQDFSDELEALLSGDTDDGVSKGLTHQIRTAMALRDQPILDQFQDEIFRLPINSQLIILGPPGTGKTTTLIKRLGQKLDREYLDEQERLIAVDSKNVPHASNWIMFTPSDLLKHYVKEAFNRELVPASDDRIKTWNSYRDDIARNVLGILKTTNSGRFIVSKKHQHLHADITRDPREWFDELVRYHRNRIVKQFSDGLETITVSCPEEKSVLIDEVKKALGDLSNRSLPDVYSSLNAIEVLLQPALTASREVSDKLIKAERNLLYNKDKTVFTQLAEYLSSLLDDTELEDDDDLFDDESESVESAAQPSQPNDTQKAVKAYTAALRSLSRYKYRKRSVSKTSKAAKIREWLKDRVPSDEVLLQIGQETTFQNGLRRFINPSRRYLSEVPNSYRGFRKALLNDSSKYQQQMTSTYHIDSTELDAMVLLMLRNARELLSQTFVSKNIEDTKFTTVAKVTGLFKTQVLADEATDFSVLQLACMESLTRIESLSFFACGDFNQRITGNGIRSIDQLKWINPRLKEEKITTVYRQSQALNDFAKLLLETQGGDLSSLGKLPENSNHYGVKPVLKEKTSSLEEIASWLANRIAEIEQAVGQTPTIAVLVNSEDEVKPLAEALGPCLENLSLQAVGCLEGQSLGQGKDVRVFDVQHIKGLEFEAVFFIGIDQLAEKIPELFDRFLYVGATRAATYLGLICHNEFPSSLEKLRPQFIEDWS
ncbi:MAG: ATP-binding domain-containing protein, partial [Gammaproteobacteria bacterium]|nr:ATP-binding domain-containing protein [Gammaproteobacteria bacterium]